MTLSVAPLRPRCRLRIPTVSEDGLAGTMARANDRDRAAAVAHVEAALPGLDLEAAADRPGPVDPTLVDVALVRPGPDDMWPFITTEHLIVHPPSVSGLAPGTTPHLDGPAGIVALLTQATVVRFEAGAALVGSFAYLADAVATVLSARSGVAVLAAGPNAPVVSSWDDHDTLVVPLDGPVRVALVEPAEPAAIPAISPPPHGPPAWEGELEPGSTMMVPRGWGHRRQASGSWWVELSFRRQRGTDVAAYLADRAAGELPFRESFPWDPDDVAPRPDSIFGDPDGLRKRFEELDLAGFEAESRAAWAADLAPLRTASGAEAQAVLDGERSAALGGPGGWVIVDRLAHDLAPLAAEELAVARARHLFIGTETDLSTLVDHPLAGAAADVALRTGLAAVDADGDRSVPR